MDSDPGSNKAVVWFRALLWFMPAAFLLVSMVGISWLGHGVRWIHYPVSLALSALWILNIAFTIGTAWFRAVLHPNWEGREKFGQIITFSLSQIVVIPLILFGATMIVYAIGYLRD
jgi:hypothetical protein